MMLDPGIRWAVEVLREYGVETFESCEGGEGHAYPEPTVALLGRADAGWLALHACIQRGLPVQDLRQMWHIEDGVSPRGPVWNVVFKEKVPVPEGVPTPHLDYLEGRSQDE